MTIIQAVWQTEPTLKSSVHLAPVPKKNPANYEPLPQVH